MFQKALNTAKMAYEESQSVDSFMQRTDLISLYIEILVENKQ